MATQNNRVTRINFKVYIWKGPPTFEALDVVTGQTVDNPGAWRSES